jgi:5'(3')-deoxyribonucleotidase
MRHQIAIDVDNVLADSIRTWCRLVRQRLGIRIEFENITSHKLVGCVPLTPTQIFELQDEVWSKWMSLPTTERDVAGTINQLHRMRYRVNVATSGPSRHTNYVKEWLARNRIAYDTFENVPTKCGLSADILVDDAPEEISAFAGSGRRAFLYDRPWNRALSGREFSRIATLRQLTRHLRRASVQTELLAVKR